ncbi:hypothetical protein AGMMS49593_06270 [Endomicrobiia bacterium]|nr:hypothetical protein AGMMS49593_06270 [Endomicrobiia bacterium]
MFSVGAGFAESDVDGSFFFFGNERGISTDDESFGTATGSGLDVAGASNDVVAGNAA